MMRCLSERTSCYWSLVSPCMKWLDGNSSEEPLCSDDEFLSHFATEQGSGSF